MRKIYVTFSGSPYEEQTQLIVERAPQLGADEVLIYDDQWFLEHDFLKVNRWLVDHPHKRGCFWYTWKPLVILDALSKLQDGDIVMYGDADTYPTGNFAPLYDQCAKDGAMLFRACSYSNRQYCKRDAFVTMAQDEPRYHDAQAGVARHMLFQKGPWKPQQFLYEWLTYCVNPLATTFDPSVLKPELSGFVESRAEQAILTLLAHKYGYRLWPEVSYEPIPELGMDYISFEQENTRPVETRQETAPVLGSRYRNV